MDREFGIVVVGASGLTGRLVAAQVARRADLPGVGGWAAAGRNVERTRAALPDLEGGTPEVIRVDLCDAASLPTLTRRAKVILNLAGPYTPNAADLISACVATGTHYADLSGELPLLADVIARFHVPATRAGIAVVQMAGWEALPADLTTLLASRRADRTVAEGPGAAAPISGVVISASFSRVPGGRLPLSQALSAGTMASILRILADDNAGLVGRTGALLPQGAGKPGGLQLRPHRHSRRLLAPFSPVAFLNPPVVHRTAALRALETGAPYVPARYVEGEETGSAVTAWARAAGQRMIVGLAHAPRLLRRTVAIGLRQFLPPSGTGPSGRFLTDWAWTVRAEARTSDGRTGMATLEGRGHPGYAATAAMIAEVGLRLATGRASARAGCLTPALVLGSLDLDPWFVEGLRLD